MLTSTTLHTSAVFSSLLRHLQKYYLATFSCVRSLPTTHSQLSISPFFPPSIPTTHTFQEVKIKLLPRFTGITNGKLSQLHLTQWRKFWIIISTQSLCGDSDIRLQSTTAKENTKQFYCFIQICKCNCISTFLH